MSENATIIIHEFLNDKIKSDAFIQCGMCKYMIIIINS